MSLRVALLLPALALGAQGAPQPSPDEQAIKALVERFRTALIARDAVQLRSVFMNGSVPFVSVGLKDGTARPYSSTADAFVIDVLMARQKYEEKFWDFQIRTDGAVGSLSASYSFHLDGVMTNQGMETWALARTPEGWKAVSVTWSVKPPAR